MEHPYCNFEGCVKPSKYRALLICSACRAVRYCDSGCQKAAWKGHKDVCDIVSEDRVWWWRGCWMILSDLHLGRETDRPTDRQDRQTDSMCGHLS